MTKEKNAVLVLPFTKGELRVFNKVSPISGELTLLTLSGQLYKAEDKVFIENECVFTYKVLNKEKLLSDLELFSITMEELTLNEVKSFFGEEEYRLKPYLSNPILTWRRG